jgi:hypothetical protein
MGVFDLGAFDNDCALDFIDDFLDVESPVRSIRAALARLDQDCYHQNDEVYQAWAACELVAIVSSGGEGYDVDDPQYEAAARLRPNRELVAQCLKTLTHILDENSELSDLVDAEQRVGVEAALAQTRARLEKGLALDKFPRLKVPKIKAMQVYAVAAAGKWIVALYDYSNLFVLDAVYDRAPESVEQIPMDDMTILFNCRFMGSVDDFSGLGRLRPPEALTETNEYVTVIRCACSSSSDMVDFETNYWLNRGRKFTQQHYDDVREYPYCPEILPDRFAALVEEYVASGTLEFPPVPTPTELRDEFLESCQSEWARHLEGDGAGPFSFPHLFEMDVSYFMLPWIKLHLRTTWTNAGMCLRDDLFRYFLAGVVAASVGAYAESDVPESLVPILEPLTEHIGNPEITGAIHVLSCVLKESSVIPHVLRYDPPRRMAFLNQASSLRDALTATL